MTRATKKMTNPWDQAQLRFYEGANSDKKSESGLNFFWSDGVNPNAGLLGELSLPVSVPKFRSLMIINSDPAIQYIAFTDGHVLPKVIAPAPLVLVQTDPSAANPSATGYFQMASIAGLNIGDHMYFWDALTSPTPSSGYLVSMDPTFTNPATVDGTLLGIITVADASGFALGEWINVENTIPIGPANGYIVGIVDLGGPGPYQIHVQDFPFGGFDVDLSGYTVALGASIYHMPVGFLVHMQDAPIGGADVDLSAHVSFLVGCYLYTYGLIGAINAGFTNLETITTTTPHGYKVGDNISIVGVTDPWFDWPSNVIISVPSPTSFIVAGGGNNRVSGAGTTDLGIPFDAISGIPIPPNGGKLIVAIGDNNILVQASSANVFGYLSKNSIIQLPDNP